jgi:HD-GYP domain-containing protein (c-di-GMP phosphodiesterase class II)
MAARTPGIPLRWIISLGIMAITLLLSATLITRAYLDQRSLLLEASGNSARQLAEIFDSAGQRLLIPVQNSAQLLVHDPLVQAETLAERLERLPALVQVLKINTLVSAVYVGYQDSDFLLLRDLSNPQTRSLTAAPAEARWLVQSIDHHPDAATDRVWLFFDANLQLLEQHDKPDYLFNPHERPWYAQARQADEAVLTAPYLFFTTHEVGVTLSQAAGERAVIGIDASVADLSSQLSLLQPGPDYRLAVVNTTGTLVAWPEVEKMIVSENGGVRLAALSEMDAPELLRLQALNTPAGEMVSYQADGRDWYGTRLPLLAIQGEALQLLIGVPASTLLAQLRDQGERQVLWSLAIALLALLAGWWLAYWLTQPVDRLSTWVQALSRFDFRHERVAPSGVREVNELNAVLATMASTIRHFQSISRTLAQERQLEQMLPRVAGHLKASVQAHESAIYLYDPEQQQLQLASLDPGASAGSLPKHITTQGHGASALREAVSAILPSSEGEWLITPLLGREPPPSGVLLLCVPRNGDDAETRLAGFIEELSGSAATAIEMRQLIGAQKRLLDAIIRLLADAIDAKSPHTSQHCERVPELAQMLVDAACQSEEGEFADFTMNSDQRYEFHLAAWLHDCGKLTTPEYVLDKGTKLETLYNRIHEVRTRFEVLWRDAEIRYLKGVIEQGDEPILHERLLREQAELQADFECVARINIGAESLADEDVAAIRRIGERSWLRHFDKRLGLSDTELQRLGEEGELPIKEHLLADRPEHLLPWNGRRPPVEADNPDNHWGFDMALPAHERNLGELYNLTQPYGTLTPEERFTINNHIVQTIRMLESLPLPPSLQRLPDIAGNHHERIDGRGYPRKLKAGALSIPERVMALADVFEALTASDRPYKKAKTLSESIRILAKMTRDGHLDRQVFKLFLDSGVYQAYARRFLQPEQIDQVDLRQLWLLAKTESSTPHQGL